MLDNSKTKPDDNKDKNRNKEILFELIKAIKIILKIKIKKMKVNNII